MADGLERQGRSGRRELQLVPLRDRHDHQHDQQDGRQNRPPDLELRSVVNLNADRRRVLTGSSAEHVSEPRDVARHVDRDRRPEDRHELEDAVDRLGRVAGRHVPGGQHPVKVAEEDVRRDDEVHDRQHERDRPEACAEAFGSDDLGF